MNINDIIIIHTFDDGNQRFINFPNEWKVTKVMYNGGKLELVNNIDNEVQIYSISTWKVRLNIEECDNKVMNSVASNCQSNSVTTESEI